MARRVLVVDDEKGIADSLTVILTFGGFECAAAYNGEDAMRLVASFKPDLVISDVIMPGLSGVDLASELRMAQPSIPIILLSGNAATEELLTNADERIGSALVLPKPYSPRELVKLVGQLLDVAQKTGT